MEFKELKKYFWDCDFEELSMEKYSKFIIERVLNFGNAKEVRWLIENTDEGIFKKVATSSRRLDRKTANYWKKYYQNYE